ncbi:MAG: D-aminoacyl-tRNA deacylase [Planctomycetota bacterium]|nr:D-aminoacyl-tRNA deacylase [Planctomycetota bacterium]MDA1112800.1 D-aminoacyl-tRNA deacylase [Planctomycetota bacterium]
MKALVQRVDHAEVVVEEKVVGKIGLGFLIYLGCQVGDGMETAGKMADRLAKLRIFEDADGKTNLDLNAVEGSILLISQFTLAADLRRGNRPSFTTALAPDEARLVFEEVRQILENKGFRVESGVFGAHMRVGATNVGPATYLLEIE